MSYSHLLHTSFIPTAPPSLRCCTGGDANLTRPILPFQSKIREIFMPALSSTMTEGKIVSWVKSEGEKLAKAESVVVVDEGLSAAVGSTIALLAESEEEIALSQSQKSSSSPPVSAPATADTEASKVLEEIPSQQTATSASVFASVTNAAVNSVALASAVHPASEGGKRVVASPYAKKFAKDFEVDLRGLTGSGPNGRVLAKDVEAALAAAKVSGSGVTPMPTEMAKLNGVELGSVVQFTTMQGAVSRNMVMSLAVPTFRVGYTITTDALDSLYKKVLQEIRRCSSLTSTKVKDLLQEPFVGDDTERVDVPLCFITSVLCSSLSWLTPIQVAQASEDIRENAVYKVGELFELGIQLSYLLLLLAFLGVGSFFVIRQVLVRRELDLSAKELQEQVRSGDASATELFELGAVMLRRKFYPAATKFLLQAIDKWDGDDQDLAQVYNALGVSYVRDGKVEKGIAQFESAVKLQPGYVTAWNNLGDAYEKSNNLKSALKAFEEVLLFDPNNKIARPRRDELKEKVSMYKGVPVKSKKK